MSQIRIERLRSSLNAILFAASVEEARGVVIDAVAEDDAIEKRDAEEMLRLSDGDSNGQYGDLR